MRAAEEALWGGAARFENGQPVTGQSLVQVVVELLDSGYPLIPEHNQQKNKLFYQTDDGSYQPVGSRFDDREIAKKVNGTTYFVAINKRLNREEYRPLYVGSPESKDGYLAFPLRSEDGKPGGKVLEGVSFRLILTYPRSNSLRANAIAHRFPDGKGIEHEITAALWAWETFGGLGARTRRGFGALMLRNGTRNGQELTIHRPNDSNDLRRWIIDTIQSYVTPGPFPNHVPHLTSNLAFAVSGQHSTGKAAWRHLGQKLRGFRQRRREDYRRRKGFGRSRWPEPDAVRDLAGTSYEDLNDSQHNHHAPIHKPKINAFPRAAFGLPISFEFQREQTNVHRTRSIDPPGKNTLEGDDPTHERLASPLILRPLFCSDNRFVGLAAILEGVQLPPMQLTVQRGRSQHIQKGITAALSPSEAQTIGREADIEPLKRATTTVTPRDILLAFLETL
jgi:CRISPR-associated protein Cmr1